MTESSPAQQDRSALPKELAKQLEGLSRQLARLRSRVDVLEEEAAYGLRRLERLEEEHACGLRRLDDLEERLECLIFDTGEQESRFLWQISSLCQDVEALRRDIGGQASSYEMSRTFTRLTSQIRSLEEQIN